MRKEIERKLKMVVLENPYAEWGDPFTQDIFLKIIDLKKRCYEKYYSQRYAPVDKWDFHGTHISVCEEKENGKLYPLTSFRMVTNKVCNQYGHLFNGQTIIDSAGDTEHRKALLSYLDKRKNKLLGVASGLAFEPNISLYDSQKRELRDIFLPLFVYGFINCSLDGAIVIGVCASKLNSLYVNKLGFNVLSNHTGELDPIRVPSAGNEVFDVMTLDEIIEPGLRLAEKYLPLWRDRIHICSGKVSNEKDLVCNHFDNISLSAA